jgi:hypothetical protein
MLAVVAVCLLAACGGDDTGDPSDGDTNTDGDTVIDGDADGDTVLDGDADSDTAVDGDDDLWDAETIRGALILPRGAGVLLTPSAYDAASQPGDGTWRYQDNHLDDPAATNFAYTAEGLILGYGALSRQVKIGLYGTLLPADNGALLNLVEGPFSERTAIPIEEDSYLYLYMEDGGVTYYLRLFYDYKTGDGVHGSYEFSTSPKFP